MRIRCTLPNQFRCQTSKPFRFTEKARPRAVRNLLRQRMFTWSACFQIGVTIDGNDLETANENGGAERDRTADPLLAKQVLSQLSYSPILGACFRNGGPG